MKNKEKFVKEILDIACEGKSIGVSQDTNSPVICSNLKCSECLLNSRATCGEALKEWCESEYVEPQIDWSKVAVDTPILVKDTENSPWRKRYFSHYANNIVYAYSNGMTSWSSSLGETIGWKYAKLAE